MRLLCALLISLPLLGALGDKAPAIPSTWPSSHPALPFPSNAFLILLHNNRPSYYTNACDNYLSLTGQPHVQLRLCVLAYQAAKAAGANLASEPYATWKSTIITALDKLGLTFQTIIASDDSVTADGAGGITTSINLTSACAGTCNGQIVSVYGRNYSLTVNSANSGTLVNFNRNSAASASSLYPAVAAMGFKSGAVKIRIATEVPNLDWSMSIYAPMVDWMWSDLTSTQQTDFAESLDGMCEMVTQHYNREFPASGGYSPFNDLFYGPGSNSQFAVGLGMGAVTLSISHANGKLRMRQYADMLFNVVLPAWKRMGGATIEGWDEYVNAPGQNQWIVSFLLPWAHASGRGSAFFTVDHPYVQNFALFYMNILRPDFALPKLGETKTFFSPEQGNLCAGSIIIGMFPGLAEIYNNSTIRGFSRKLNGECGASNDSPSGYVPSAWPWWEPDATAKTTTALSTLPKQAHFPGVGIISLRTGWTESDTQVLIDYGDKHWTGKEYGSAGHFQIFSRGSLAITSGIPAGTGTLAKHRKLYANQTIAHNSLLFLDSADVYTSQYVDVQDNGASVECVNLPNDGGQRRVNALQNHYLNAGCTGGFIQNGNIVAPIDDAHWVRNREWWKQTNLLAYVPNAAYTYVAIDMTRAYQREGATPTMQERTKRLVKAVRHFLFIPRGTSAYLLVYDQTITTSSAFSKTWLLHSINEPAISSNHFTITRTENAATKGNTGYWPFGWMQGSITNENTSCSYGACYQYNGRLEGWSFVNGSARTPTALGGSGNEFKDAPGGGTNQNLCQNSIYCGSGTADGGLGSTAGEVHPEADAAPFEPGAWRLELTPPSAATTDHFLVLMYATDDDDTITQASVTGTTTSTTYGVTWTDNAAGCSYAATFYKSGVGGTITATGAGCATTI